MQKIIKIIRPIDWEKAQNIGEIIESSLTTEGFIHCSYEYQVPNTAAKHFSEEERILLLVVNEQKVSETLKVELAKNGEYYPHIFAPISIHAIENVFTVLKQKDGTFPFPTR
ncbi:DUF952 domain-containing protein [Priestia taiwanensis]|uniref:DUF952 domain-containing protein n=1 Tax=Priestia taiwanensis TaxID=1347902 RepID=A0A917AYP8_9BACI|nr:DUF952 domain-containing protein [Priestia taiwanensis]MBM7365244.1 uncharacterized protein (DUF952 family) [Priestia taiwanensis]GGE85420.1 hypothetical protein GCM10007140_38570 [Priestia taiwanensis]